MKETVLHFYHADMRKNPKGTLVIEKGGLITWEPRSHNMHDHKFTAISPPTLSILSPLLPTGIDHGQSSTLWLFWISVVIPLTTSPCPCASHHVQVLRIFIPAAISDGVSLPTLNSSSSKTTLGIRDIRSKSASPKVLELLRPSSPGNQLWNSNKDTLLSP